MRAKRLSAEGGTRYALIFDKGDEVIEQLLAFAREERLPSASFTGIGAFSDVMLGFFERERRDYRRIPLDEQVEVLPTDEAVRRFGELDPLRTAAALHLTC